MRELEAYKNVHIPQDFQSKTQNQTLSWFINLVAPLFVSWPYSCPSHLETPAPVIDDGSSKPYHHDQDLGSRTRNTRRMCFFVILCRSSIYTRVPTPPPPPLNLTPKLAHVPPEAQSILLACVRACVRVCVRALLQGPFRTSSDRNHPSCLRASSSSAPCRHTRAHTHAKDHVLPLFCLAVRTHTPSSSLVVNCSAFAACAVASPWGQVSYLTYPHKPGKLGT